VCCLPEKYISLKFCIKTNQSKRLRSRETEAEFNTRFATGHHKSRSATGRGSEAPTGSDVRAEGCEHGLRDCIAEGGNDAADTVIYFDVNDFCISCVRFIHIMYRALVFG